VPELYLKEGVADAVGLGQGELTFWDFVQAVDNGTDVATIYPGDTLTGVTTITDGKTRRQLTNTTKKDRQARWSPDGKSILFVSTRSGSSQLWIIDLDGGAGAMLAGSAPSDPATSMRFGYPGKLATSVRGRLKRLQAGANPAELQLGHDCSIEQCTTLLGHLDSRWYQISRRRSDLPGKTIELCSGGLPAAYFRASGHMFERKDHAARLSFAESEKLQTLGAVPDPDRGRESAEAEWAWEQWEGTCERRDASVVRASSPRHRWMLDQLAIVRIGGELRTGYVTRVALGADEQLGAEGQLALTLRMWSANPVAMTLLPLSAASSDDPPLPALRFDETPDDKASLVLPPRTFNPSRVLRSLDVGPGRRFRLTRLLHRGIDFERAAFEEADA
jgi:hypothetical protein